MRKLAPFTIAEANGKPGLQKRLSVEEVTRRLVKRVYGHDVTAAEAPDTLGRIRIGELQPKGGLVKMKSWDASWNKTLISECKQNSIPPALPYAISAVESNWNPTAVSPVGAIGLFQIMPKSAFGAEGQCNEIIKSADDLKDPLKAIPCGIKILKGLITNYEGVLLSIFGNYNCGATEKWVQTVGQEGMINIRPAEIGQKFLFCPYEETEPYVYTCMEFYKILVATSYARRGQ